MELALSFPKSPQISKTFKAKTINLTSNHFTFTLAKNQPLISLYDLKILKEQKDEQFEIPDDDRIQRKRVLLSCMKELREFFGRNCCFSGQVLWSFTCQQELKTFETQVDTVKYSIIFTKTKSVSLSAETFQNKRLSDPAIQLINILIKRFFDQKNYVEWGMNSRFYDPEKINNIEEFYLQVYEGYKTSCKIYQDNSPKILIDFSSKILRSDNVLWYMKNEANTDKERLAMLQGQYVVASYGNYQMWRIDNIDFKASPAKKMETNNKGEKISLAEYYKTKYGIQIRDMNQPLLVSNDWRKNKIYYLIPELVQMTGLSDKMRKDYRLMTEVAKLTRLSPNQRMDSINGFAKSLSDNLAKEYGIQMTTENTVQGHVLNPPKISVGGKNSFVPSKGGFQIKDMILSPVPIEEWLLVFHESSEKDANALMKNLQDCSGTFAIKLGKPIMKCLKDKKPEVLKEALRASITPRTKIVVCILAQGQDSAWYKAFKDVCSQEKGVVSQAVRPGSFKKNTMAVCSKLLLQINAKMGAKLWETERPGGLPPRSMIIGADVFHNTKIGQEKKSCIGFCASLNHEMNKFFSKVSFQKRLGQEIMTNIGKLVKEAVLKYFKHNNKEFLPEYIFFFRDGVAENQLNSILKYETQSILDELRSIGEDYNFKFAEIIVTKRIDDRIFTASANKREFMNPPAGTVVASEIVSDSFNYLLVSQNVTQGTCTPTHYNVIYDTTGLPQDVFWNLTYSQCYNYYNWTGSVKVPAPVQYAHKLAYLVGQTIQGVPSENLDESFYYL